VCAVAADKARQGSACDTLSTDRWISYVNSVATLFLTYQIMNGADSHSIGSSKVSGQSLHAGGHRNANMRTMTGERTAETRGVDWH
jgi:hypothetical protein